MPWAPDPRRDAAGIVIPHDDPDTIPSEWALLRHVHPEHWHEDGLRPQSIAFTFSSEGSHSMSVDVERPMLDDGLAPTHYAFKAGRGVVRITARKARELDMQVGPEPVSGNPHHGGIWKPNPSISENQLEKRRRVLSRSCVLVALPPGGITRKT
jgi:hypothetical protein